MTECPTHSRRHLWAVCGLMLALGGHNAIASGPATVFVSILPQVELTAAIGGPEVQVRVLVGPGQSPATYEPTPRQMGALASSRLFFRAGVPFERALVAKIAALGNGPLIAGTAGMDRTSDLDPHRWLDPIQTIAMADTVCARLSQLIPAAAASFAARRDTVVQRLRELDVEIATLLAPVRGKSFFVFHPAYGHFARRYGLVQIAVEEHGHAPRARQLATTIERVRALGARAIFVQPQFSQRSAQTVAQEAGLEVLVLNPLAGDYTNNLRHIAQTLAQYLESSP